MPGDAPGHPVVVRRTAGTQCPHPRGGDVSRSLRFVPVTKTERRVAKALALEPGGPPTAQARIAGQGIKALLKTGWRFSAARPAGLLRIQRITALAGGAQQVPRGVEITPE